MKFFLTIILLIFNLQSLTKADDVSDLEIEGISIGDSLLNFFSAEEIEKGNPGYIYNDNSFYETEFYNHKSFSKYENINIGLKKNDNNYIVYRIVGFNFMEKRKEKCFNMVDEVAKEVEGILSNTKISIDNSKHTGDPSGKSLTRVAYMIHKSGEIWIECYDWSDEITKEKGWTDNFGVNIMSNEYIEWLDNKAY